MDKLEEVNVKLDELKTLLIEVNTKLDKFSQGSKEFDDVMRLIVNAPEEKNN